MRKLILTIITVLIFSVQSAFAFVQFAVPVIAVAAASLIAASAGVYYAMTPRSATSHFVDNVGNLSRSASCLYIAMTSAPVPEIQSVPVHAKMDFLTAQSMATKKNADGSNMYPTAYPKFVGINTLKTSDYAGSSPVKPSLPLNSLLLQDISTLTNYSKYLKVTTVPSVHSTSGYTCAQSGNTGVSVNASYIVLCEDHTNPTSYTTYSYGYANNQPAPPPSPLPPSTVAANLSGSSSGGAIVDASLQDELDRMFKDSSYIPTFTDDTTGLPYAPPAGLPSAAEIASAVAHANSVAAAAAAAGSSQTAAQQAAAAATSAAAAAAAHPDDPALQNAAAAAAATAASAQAAADALAAQQAAASADDAAAAVPADPEAYGDGEKFDFGARMRRFIEEMKATSIFSLPSQVLGNIPGGGTSVINVSFGRMGSTSFDFADFSGSLAVLRVLVLIIFSYCGFRIVTLKGGGG